MLRVCLPVHFEGELEEGAKAFLASTQRVLRPLALGNIPHQAQVTLSALLKTADANLYRKGCPVLAPVVGLESDRLPGDHALLQALDGHIIETNVKIAFVFADQFLTAVAQVIAGLAVDVENGPILVKQQEGVSRMIHEGAEALFARAQLIR